MNVEWGKEYHPPIDTIDFESLETMGLTAPSYFCSVREFHFLMISNTITGNANEQWLYYRRSKPTNNGMKLSGN